MNILKSGIAVLAASVLLLSFAGCDKDSDDNDNDPGSTKPACTSPVSQVNGDWTDSRSLFTNINVNECDVDLMKEDSDQRMNFLFVANKNGQKTVQPNDTVVEKVTLAPYKVNVTLLSQQYVDGVNANNLCGYSDWSLNVAKDVSGCADLGLDDTLPVGKDIAYIEGNKVMFGDDSIGIDGYPDTLDPNNYWTKK